MVCLKDEGPLPKKLLTFLLVFRMSSLKNGFTAGGLPSGSDEQIGMTRVDLSFLIVDDKEFDGKSVV